MIYAQVLCSKRHQLFTTIWSNMAGLADLASGKWAGSLVVMLGDNTVLLPLKAVLFQQIYANVL